ncbi:hypothetical protein [Aquabacterium sp.]|uniref:hypothetical protein n=1 Tax=Aquabacterium sp. TaxID=1872578 RepID=UPI0019C94EE1|nr:hypothetical protein [Aquabacterium sp.]MBC7699617.1 hypothetical protein [Aquabacterium sp.]
MKSLIIIGLLTSSAAALAANRVLLETPITYAPGASVVEKVKQECQIENMLETRVGKAFGNLNKGGDSTISTGAQATDDAAVVRLRITHVLGVGGGAWSGPKAITIDADLIEKNKVVRHTKINRWTTGGAFGGFKGTCSILERSAAAIGKDLARWVRDPAFTVPDEPQPAGQVGDSTSAPSPADKASSGR